MYIHILCNVNAKILAEYRMIIYICMHIFLCRYVLCTVKGLDLCTHVTYCLSDVLNRFLDYHTWTKEKFVSNCSLVVTIGNSDKK
jgi:hypothetical protein